MARKKSFKSLNINSNYNSKDCFDYNDILLPTVNENCFKPNQNMVNSIQRLEQRLADKMSYQPFTPLQISIFNLRNNNSKKFSCKSCTRCNREISNTQHKNETNPFCSTLGPVLCNKCGILLKKKHLEEDNDRLLKDSITKISLREQAVLNILSNSDNDSNNRGTLNHHNDGNHAIRNHIDGNHTIKNTIDGNHAIRNTTNGNYVVRNTIESTYYSGKNSTLKAKLKSMKCIKHEQQINTPENIIGKKLLLPPVSITKTIQPGQNHRRNNTPIENDTEKEEMKLKYELHIRLPRSDLEWYHDLCLKKAKVTSTYSLDVMLLASKLLDIFKERNIPPSPPRFRSRFNSLSSIVTIEEEHEEIEENKYDEVFIETGEQKEFPLNKYTISPPLIHFKTRIVTTPITP